MIVAMATEAKREVLHRGQKFDFERVECALADGSTLVREVVRHPGAVVVAPLLDGGRVALIRNFRAAVGETLWELPAGTLEEGEDPAACAARELEEEAGFSAGRIEPLGSFYTTPGMTDELMRVFAATDLREVGQALEHGEEIEVVVRSVDEAMAMIDSGELRDAKSILALLLAQRRGLLL